MTQSILRRPRITADRNIPFISEALADVGELRLLPGDAINRQVMSETDILLTRTRTKCNAELLGDSPCTFIGTATIGTDHIDLPWCASRGITVANAPGCNTPAVAQYVLAAIGLTLHDGETFSDRTLGIIGVGNVGSILARWASGLGMKVMLNDPPRQKREDGHLITLNNQKLYIPFTSLDKIAASCDVISIHTPYTTSGRYATRHLIGAEFLSVVRRKPLIINAARGGVTDTAALKRTFSNETISALAIDCWEGEPEIDHELLDMAIVATPHIAGYSMEGKIRASRMVLEALASHLYGRYASSYGNTAYTPSDVAAYARQLISALPAVAPVPEFITPSMLSYDIASDTHRLKSAFARPQSIPTVFESLRNSYTLRPEPHL